MTLERLWNLVKELARECFHGRIIVSFENGKVTHVRKEETIK